MSSTEESPLPPNTGQRPHKNIIIILGNPAWLTLNNVEAIKEALQFGSLVITNKTLFDAGPGYSEPVERRRELMMRDIERYINTINKGGDDTHIILVIANDPATIMYAKSFIDIDPWLYLFLDRFRSYISRAAFASTQYMRSLSLNRELQMSLIYAAIPGEPNSLVSTCTLDSTQPLGRKDCKVFIEHGITLSAFAETIKNYTNAEKKAVGSSNKKEEPKITAAYVSVTNAAGEAPNVVIGSPKIDALIKEAGSLYDEVDEAQYSNPNAKLTTLAVVVGSSDKRKLGLPAEYYNVFGAMYHYENAEHLKNAYAYPLAPAEIIKRNLKNGYHTRVYIFIITPDLKPMETTVQAGDWRNKFVLPEGMEEELTKINKLWRHCGYQGSIRFVHYYCRQEEKISVCTCMEYNGTIIKEPTSKALLKELEVERLHIKKMNEKQNTAENKEADAKEDTNIRHIGVELIAFNNTGETVRIPRQMVGKYHGWHGWDSRTYCAYVYSLRTYVDEIIKAGKKVHIDIFIPSPHDPIVIGGSAVLCSPNEVRFIDDIFKLKKEYEFNLLPRIYVYGRLDKDAPNKSLVDCNRPNAVQRAEALRFLDVSEGFLADFQPGQKLLDYRKWIPYMYPHRPARRDKEFLMTSGQPVASYESVGTVAADTELLGKLMPFSYPPSIPDLTMLLIGKARQGSK